MTSRKPLAVNGWERPRIEVHGASCGGHLPAVAWTAKMMMMMMITEQKPSMIVDNSVLQQCCLMKRKYTAASRQHKDDEGYHVRRSGYKTSHPLEKIMTSREWPWIWVGNLTCWFKSKESKIPVTKRPTPPPLLLTLGSAERRNHGGGVISARSLEVSFVVSQVSVIPRRSIPLLNTRSDRAGALSLIERALPVPRRRFGATGPGCKLTSPASSKSRDKPRFNLTRGGSRIFLFAQRRRDGIRSNDGDRAITKEYLW